MKWWIVYQNIVKSNTLDQASHTLRGLDFWRNILFTNIIMYLLPVSFIALIPGVIMSFSSNIPLLGVYDMLAVLMFAAIGLVPNITLLVRKWLFVLTLYFITVVLLIYLGSFGPGLLYFLAITIFISLIFGTRQGYISVGLNTFLCLGFAVVIHFQVLEVKLVNIYSIGSWIAVSSNLIFLGLVIVASLDLLFSGLQATIEKEDHLQTRLKAEGVALEKMVNVLQTKNQELEQFAYIASHDLQEPLQTVSSFTILLEKQYQGQLDQTADVYLNYISQSVSRMQALISGLLDYARIGHEKQPELVNCNDILKAVMDDLDATIKASNANIKLGHFPTIEVYPVEFKQLFQNLVSNAIKFRKEGIFPEISITAAEEQSSWVFSVADNGIGIDKVFYEKIFVIYQRLHPRSKYEGTGIGLAHCKKIVELHGGKIWVESEPNAGSIFYFRIPKK